MPCSAEILTLTPACCNLPNSPNPLELSATERVKTIQAYYSDSAYTNMVGIWIDVTDGGVDTWYFYGTDSIYWNFWYSPASS